MRSFRFLLLLVLLTPLKFYGEEIILATYYNYLPWATEHESSSGLNYDLAKFLTEQAKGKYKFKAMYLPRKRIDVMLGQKQAIVVAWIRPKFFDDADKTKYDYSSDIFEDESLYVSPKSKPFEYTGPESLKGKAFSGSMGHVYFDIDPLVKEGTVRRDDAPSLKEALIKLTLKDRNLDFSIIDRSALHYFKKEHPAEASELYISKVPRTPSFYRSLLVQKNKPELLNFLNESIAKLKKSHEWQEKLKTNN